MFYESGCIMKEYITGKHYYIEQVEYDETTKNYNLKVIAITAKMKTHKRKRITPKIIKISTERNNHVIDYNVVRRNVSLTELQ